MKKLLFETNLTGHRMEYVHHIYMGMLEHLEDEYVIVVPEEFIQKRGLYYWPDASHIKFAFMPNISDNNEEEGVLRQSIRRSRLLRHFVKKEKADCVLLITLMAYIPTIGLLIPRKVRVSGIIYTIYLYRWKNSSWKSHAQDVMKYLSIRFAPCVKNVFVLNDMPSAAKLNKLYHTDKFRFITDPYNAIDYSPKNVRKELGVKENEILFLHFGGLNRRKGTLDILKSIGLIPEERRKKSVFIFAGKVYGSIREEFYSLIKILPSDSRVIVYDRFCSNELLADLCSSSDFILMPYRSTSQSSGLLGHAAHYGTPVIGPKDGLIGKLIRKNHLGYQLNGISPEGIAEVISKVSPYRLCCDYKDQISIERFNSDIFNQF